MFLSPKYHDKVKNSNEKRSQLGFDLLVATEEGGVQPEGRVQPSFRRLQLGA